MLAWDQLVFSALVQQGILPVLRRRHRPQSAEQCSCFDFCFCSDQAPCFTTLQREILATLFLVSDCKKHVWFLSPCAGMSFMAMHNLSSKTVCVCGGQSLILLVVQGQNWSEGAKRQNKRCVFTNDLCLFCKLKSDTCWNYIWLFSLAARVLAFH